MNICECLTKVDVVAVERKKSNVNHTWCNKNPATQNLSVHTRRQTTSRDNRIKQNHSQSEKYVGGLSLLAHSLATKYITICYNQIHQHHFKRPLLKNTHWVADTIFVIEYTLFVQWVNSLNVLVSFYLFSMR